MIKIKISKDSPIFVRLLIAILFIAFAILAIYIILYDNSASSSTRFRGWELVGIVFFAFPFLFVQKGNYPKASELQITENEISVVYKNKKEIVKIETINKSDIEKFEVNVNSNLASYGKNSYIQCNTRVYIKSISNKNDISFFEDTSNMICSCPYHFILDVIKYSSNIPNFSYNLSGNADIANADIDYYYKTGKRLSFLKKIQVGSGKVGKFITVLFVLYCMAILGGVVYFLWIFMPSGKLTPEEQEYMQYYNQATDLITKNNDYYGAIEQFEKAEHIINNTVDTYLQKAYCYKKLKQYDKAIESALIGLENINNKSVYKKYHNFKFLGKRDIELYTLLGECYEKTKEYQKMKDCFTYVIQHSNYTYTDAYFYRGRSEYYMGDFQSALNDFYKHKEIIEKYFADQEAEPQYKDLYPRYDNDNLINIHKWIDACKQNI